MATATVKANEELATANANAYHMATRNAAAKAEQQQPKQKKLCTAVAKSSLLLSTYTRER
uniref:Uncharacterized protein n=1 Tax=Oryza sativa subsp. japonica TaxID=39947 RepID=Q6ZIE8_ORYSJ|nr:hypothetical protein [Oryza sativa Japonica Group]